MSLIDRLRRISPRVKAASAAVLGLGAGVGALAAALGLELPERLVSAWRAVAPFLADLAG